MANLYDMMREKAREMGHTVANAPDAAFAAAINVRDKSHNLAVAKLGIQQYMLGEMEPQQMAQLMANNPDVRLAMSDLCRMRLEPVEFNVQRGDGYIDVGAGVKTFWTEMKVPLPSERDAARDLLNINYGIEAGRQAARQTTKNDSKPQRKTFRDRINEAKQNMAKSAIDKLTPIAEGKQAVPNETSVPRAAELNETWFETDEGRQYKNNATRRMAQELENMSMVIEAGLDPNIPEPERVRALQAAGVNEAKPAELRAGYTRDELNEPLDSSMQALFDQIAQHMGQDTKKESAPETAHETAPDKTPVEFSRAKGKIVAEYEGKKVRFKENFKDHIFSDDEAAALLRGEDIVVDYTDKNDKERKVAGKLEWQTYAGRTFLGFKADFSKKVELTPEQGAETQRDFSEKQALHHPVSEQTPEQMPEEPMLSEQEPSAEEMHNMFGDEEDYYARLAKDMEGYVPEDQPPLELNESDLQFGLETDEGITLSRT